MIGLGLTWLATSWATPQHCAGTVTNLYLARDGSVLVIGSWRGDYTRLCSLNEPLNGISILTCASWMAVLSKAVSRRSTVGVYYGNAPACSTLPVYWESIIPDYVMQHD
jgi:hypothetical protein